MPGLGSFVADPSSKGHIIEIRNIADEIRSGPRTFGPGDRQQGPKADRKSAALLGVGPGTPIFHSVIVHCEAGVPIQLEERFVLGEAAPGYDKADFTRITPNEYLTQAAPLERVDHTVRAILPMRRHRNLLGDQGWGALPSAHSTNLVEVAAGFLCAADPSR